MKIMNIFLIFLFIVTNVVASEKNAESDKSAESEKNAERFGPGKAVEAFDKEEGFKLSEKAMKSLGVQFAPIAGAGPWRLPKNSLVQVKQSIGIYRRYDGWISLVFVKVAREENDFVFIYSEDLEANDEVAIQGSQFLRMTDSDLNSGTVDSCAH